MKASDAVAIVLAENHVTVGFELIGGMIAHLVDSINALGKTELMSVHHEQAAAFAAGGVARASANQQIGLALGTSGPGATNLVTGIADCWLDSHPAIFLTGQVNTYEQKQDKAIRQQGFQELDIINIVKNITKYARKIESAEELIPCLQQALDLAIEGRPGPVLLDIPMDLQRAEIPDSALDYLKLRSSAPSKVNETTETNLHDFNSVFNDLSEAKQPVFLIGGGAVNEKSFKKWINLISEQKLPSVASLKGSSNIESYSCYYGLIGGYGTRTANYAIQNSDLLIVLGSRMDVKQTGSKVEEFATHAKIIQIDIDEAQLDNRVKCHQTINSSCEAFFESYLQSDISNSTQLPSSLDWNHSLANHWHKYFDDEYQDWSISPHRLFQSLNQIFEGQSIHYVADVGNNQMWAAHSLRLEKNQSIHHSGGLGAMGFAVPTALGVCASSKLPTIIITGDGGAQLNIQELDIIVREKLPVLTLVMNNASLGMVRTFQELYFEGRNSSTFWQGYSSKFHKIGEAYNVESYSVESIEQLLELVASFSNQARPMLIEVHMFDARECRPRLEFGNPIDMQFPLISDDD